MKCAIFDILPFLQLYIFIEIVKIFIKYNYFDKYKIMPNKYLIDIIKNQHYEIINLIDKNIRIERKMYIANNKLVLCELKYYHIIKNLEKKYKLLEQKSNIISTNNILSNNFNDNYF